MQIRLQWSNEQTQKRSWDRPPGPVGLLPPTPPSWPLSPAYCNTKNVWPYTFLPFHQESDQEIEIGTNVACDVGITELTFIRVTPHLLTKRTCNQRQLRIYAAWEQLTVGFVTGGCKPAQSEKIISCIQRGNN